MKQPHRHTAQPPGEFRVRVLRPETGIEVGEVAGRRIPPHTATVAANLSGWLRARVQAP
jgi:hypothetical protein